VYLRKVIYYFLYLLEGIINFVSSIFYLYPRLDWSSAFLFFTEARRVEREMGASSAKRQKKAESALNNIEDIKKGDL
tara:strand:+ start:436 stop:666 length:231 start_codon:yes stop_codon:yes gene_type:complete